MKFQPPKGTRDFLPEEMIKREFVIQKIKQVFEKWGYEPLDTPAIESFELLAAKSGAGQAIKDEIYYFKDKADRELGLRFEFTVSTARILASDSSIPKPFKRYQIGKVWRYDNPGYGRFREFVQADIDIFGSSLPAADAEIIAVACDVFAALGFKDFVIRVSNRKILEAFSAAIGLDEKSRLEVFRSVDKLSKIGESGVIDELKNKNIAEEKIKKILDLIKISGSTKQTMEKISNIVKKIGMSAAGIEELGSLVKEIEIFGYEKNIVVDMSLVRGLEYYTGAVFEVAVAGGNLSLAGGGRYDKMIEMVGGNPTVATGIGFGLERIIEVMKENKMLDLPKVQTKVFVANVDEKVKSSALKIASQLRKENISCQTDLMNKNLTKQLEYANSVGIPYVVIVGQKEIRSKKFKLKDMQKKTEKEMQLKDIIAVLKS